MNSLTSPVKISNPHSSRLRTMTDIKIYNEQTNSKEFINYKPLSTSDNPIDPEEESIDKHTFLKMRVDYSYINPFCNSCFTMNLKSLSYKRELPFATAKKLQLFIDMDDTLIHSFVSGECTHNDGAQICDFIHINIRPFVKAFLMTVSEHYDIIVYSSATHSYIQRIIDVLDPAHYWIKAALCKEDCISKNGLLLKVINGYDKISSRNYILVDDNIANVMANEENSILICPYKDDNNDIELYKLMNFLLCIVNTDDIRKEIRQVFDIHHIYGQLTKIGNFNNNI
jgi:TFIIF-interacting CTD phosphatase-like protein